jgi:hypothetical protein
MPPKPRTTSKRLVEQEGRILLAISSLRKKKISTIRRAATVFDVPYSTLYDRINGCKYRTEKRANGHKMTPNEEELLLQWIFSMDQRGCPPTPSHVHEMASILLA